MFLVLLLGTIIIGFFSELIDYLNNKDDSLISVFQIGIFGSTLSFFTYGIFVWPPLIILSLLIETFGLKKEVSLKDVKNLFLLEIIVVAVLSLCISSAYHYYYWLLLIPIFTFGEFLRVKYLK